jgi:ubiquinone/menaquinone biosynthesis C-methylase UbiE
MNHQDHVQLLEGGVPAQQPDGVWADLGSGWGAFTLALADLLGPGTIYSVDKDGSALREQEGEMRVRFPSTNVQYLRADFTKRLDLPPLDGIVMANALHFVRHKEPVLDIIRSYLKPEGRLILVEYNADSGNMWVPFPLSYPTWERLAERSGFAATRLLTTVPSRFLREIYSALSVVG